MPDAPERASLTGARGPAATRRMLPTEALIVQRAGQPALWVICPAAIEAEEPPGNGTQLPFVGGPT